ncbi:MAG: phospholipase D-like domain-containing protein [Firmicutes bacterium]|nr:phospholipase D-like domain-containing protein [Bacillota bacterium]
MKKKLIPVLFILLVLAASLMSINTGVCQEAARADSTLAVHTLIVEPDDGKAQVLEGINQAKQSIRLTIYEIGDPDILDALKSAAQRGVEVKIIFNYHSFSEAQRGKILDIMRSLESKGVKTKVADRRFAHTHQKSFVFDDKKAIIMSFNLQSNYFTNTRDFGIITLSSQEIDEITKVFEADWLYSDITPSEEDLVWSPVNSNEKLIDLIRSAKKTIEIYNEEVADKEILDELIKAAQTGVEIRFISAQLIGYDGRDGNIYGRKKLNDNGVKAKYGDFLYIHAKMILVDYGTENARVFVGSENFSYTSLQKNRELGIIVEENNILDRLHSIFNTDWDKSKFD